MRLSAIFIAIALAANLTYGQNPSAEPKAAEAKPVQPASQEPLEADVIHVKTLTGDSFRRLANMLNVFNVRIASDENLRTIVVYAPKDIVTQMRRVVAELDTPGSEAAIGRNIEMTLTFLRCSTKAPATTSTLPPEIEAVAKQLRASTQYKDIELWDVVPLRLQEGKDTTEDMFLPDLGSASPSNIASPPPSVNIRITPEAATRKGQSWSVRFSRLNINFRMPVVTGTSKDGPSQIGFRDVGLNTAGDFLEGQKTVLGKVSGTENDTAIFVVISLKVLD